MAKLDAVMDLREFIRLEKEKDLQENFSGMVYYCKKCNNVSYSTDGNLKRCQHCRKPFKEVKT